MSKPSFPNPSGPKPSASPPHPPHPIQQTAHNVGNDAIQVAGNYSVERSFNVNVMISVFFISMLALGGIAWALSLGLNPRGDANQTDAVPTVQLDEQ